VHRAAFLLIVVGTDFVQRKAFAAAPIVAGLSYALLAMNLLYINQFPDRAADTAAGKLHWVARLPVQQGRWGYALIVTNRLPVVVGRHIAGLVAAVRPAGAVRDALSIKAASLLLRHAAQPQQLGGAIKLTIAAMLAHGALLSLGLILG